MRVFYELYERQLVYRDLKPVYWSPSSKTALAEAELEYNPRYKVTSVSLRLKMIKYPKSIQTNENVYALIWTTMPWSIVSNQMVCFHPELEYCAVKLSDRDGLYIVGKSLIDEIPNVDQVVVSFSGGELNDCSYYHPINVNEVMPVHPGHHVSANKGTGLVHIAPAHGPDDFLISLAHKISPVKICRAFFELFQIFELGLTFQICYVDEQGNFTADAPEFLRFKSALNDGPKLVLEHIERDVISAIETTINYPIDWRTKQPVIIRTSKQWFINTDRIKETALDAVREIGMQPSAERLMLLISDLQCKHLSAKFSRLESK